LAAVVAATAAPVATACESEPEPAAFTPESAVATTVSPSAAPTKPPDPGPRPPRPTEVTEGYLADLPQGPRPEVDYVVGGRPSEARGGRLVGVVNSDPLVAEPNGRAHFLGDQPQPAGLALMTDVRAVSDRYDLLFGRRGGPFQERTAAVDLHSGAVRWTSRTWWVRGVSSDGRLCHAFSSPTGGDTSSIAVLDAGTGRRLAEMDVLGQQLGESGATFEPDGDLLVAVSRPEAHDTLTTAILRLRTDGRLERATSVLVAKPLTATYVLAG
jgi:hypothetical protein